MAMPNEVVCFGTILIRLLEVLAGIVAALLLGYVFVRIASFGAARSWFHVREEFYRKEKPKGDENDRTSKESVEVGTNLKGKEGRKNEV
jgi:hypothetical protein